MKKLMTLLCLAVGFSMPVFAEVTVVPPVTYPTTAQVSFFNQQLITTIINHGTVYEEYRHGQKQMVVSDNVIEFGHVKAQYLFGITANLNSQLNIESTLRFNANALINKYVVYTPAWAWLSNLEYFPAVGYDWGEGKAHAWIATVNLGFGFGDGAGVPATK